MTTVFTLKMDPWNYKLHWAVNGKPETRVTYQTAAAALEGLEKFDDVDLRSAVVDLKSWDKIVNGRTEAYLASVDPIIEKHDGKVVVKIGERLYWNDNTKCVGKPKDHDYSNADATDIVFPTNQAALAALSDAAALGMGGTRFQDRVCLTLMQEPPRLTFPGGMSELTKTAEGRRIWEQALHAAGQITKHVYAERNAPRYSGCGVQVASDDVVEIGVVRVPEGAMEWLLHEVGHWLVATPEERKRPAYGIVGNEDAGEWACKREQAAVALEVIVLAPWGDARAIAPPSQRDGVGFERDLPPEAFKAAERALEERRGLVDLLRSVYAPWMRIEQSAA